MSRTREQRRIASVYSQLLNEAEIDKSTGRVLTRPGVLPTPGQIIQQQDASDRIARQSTLATQAGAAVDLVKLINAVRANDQQTIQQISSKYSTTANEDAEEITNIEQIGRPEDRQALAGVKYLANKAAQGDADEDFKQAAQRWMKKNNQFIDVRNILYFDKFGEPVFKETGGNFN
jgi:hypothetical protein